MTEKAKSVADNLLNELIQFGKTKRMKVKTLMKHFNYEKRTEDSATQITEILFEKSIIVHPSIMKIGDNWPLKFDDQVYLSLLTMDSSINAASSDAFPENWNSDGWFDSLSGKIFRTEKEVESKLLLPLLTRLGYTESDRYDGMPVSGAYGSRKKALEVDYGLFNKDNISLAGQVLLIAEAKKESRLVKSVELDNARNQVRSYGVFSGCLFGLITDAKIIEVISLYPIMDNNGDIEIFKCGLDELKKNFGELYKLVSKESLTHRYGKLLKIQE